MYTIRKTPKKIDSVFDAAWENAEVASVSINNWKQFDYIPKTEARLLYSDYGIHIRFMTNERPLLARYTAQNDPVSKDSCVEFFLRPNGNDKRYINFEFNPFGTMYAAARIVRDDKKFFPEDKHYFEVISYVDDGVWLLQFVIPFAFLETYYGSYTKKMYGNLYKCGGDVTHEHYLSYYPLDPKEVNFHKPEYFGEFILE